MSKLTPSIQFPTIQLLTIQQMQEMIKELKNTINNSDKISIMEAEKYSFLPSCSSTKDHDFIHALYNACQVLHLKQSTLSKDEMIEMKNAFLELLEKRNTNFDFSAIREIINDF